MMTILHVLLAGLLSRAPAAQTGAIHGRVIDRDTGRSIARAVVHLARYGAGADMLTTTTDERGAFAFEGLSPGRYGGFVTAPQHVEASIETSAAGIVVTPDRAADVTVALPRSYAMNVRVVDAFGDPLSRITLSVRSLDNRPPVMSSMRFTTDDLGRLRLFGLEPGRYVVCADTGMHGVSLEAPASRGERLVRTCYPSSDEADTEPIRVDRSDVDGVEIRMRRGRTFTISGVVLDSSGAPNTAARGSLSRFVENGSSGTGVTLDAAGRFRLTNVTPGLYVVQASIGVEESNYRWHADEAAFVPVQVIDIDVDDVVVRMVKTVDVQGRVTLEDASATLPTPGPGVFIETRLDGSMVPGSGGGINATMREDRTFTLPGTFGRRTVDVPHPPRGWYLKSIRYGDRDVTEEPVEFKSGKDAPALDVLLSNRGASVTGTVSDGDGVSAARAVVYLLRTDGRGVNLAATVRVSRTGSFRLGPVRGGEYIVVALPESAATVERTPRDRLVRLAALGERVTLTDLDERNVSVQVVHER